MYIACYTLHQRAVRKQVDQFVISGLGHDVGPPMLEDFLSRCVTVADARSGSRRGRKRSTPGKRTASQLLRSKRPSPRPQMAKALCGCPAEGDGRLVGPPGGLWQSFPFAGCPLLAAGRTLLKYT